MREPADLLADRFDHLRVAVSDVQDRDAGEEVQVLVAICVPQAATGAAHELDRVADIGGDRVLALERRELREAHGEPPIFVPWPASVNSSSSSECGTLPSTMCAA